MGVGKRGVARGLVQQFGDGAVNALPVGADQRHGAGGDGFGPFGDRAHHQDGLAEGRRLLLDPSRIGEDDMAAHHQMDERHVTLRLQQMHIRQTAQHAPHRRLYRGVEVNGVDDLHIVALRDAMQRRADLVEPVAKAFAAMPGHQDQFFGRIEKAKPRVGRSPQRRVTLQGRAHGEERVDHRVPGDDDLVGRHILLEEAGARACRRREQAVGEPVDDAAVHPGHG